jgi:hypothetical protein
LNDLKWKSLKNWLCDFLSLLSVEGFRTITKAQLKKEKIAIMQSQGNEGKESYEINMWRN